MAKSNIKDLLSSLSKQLKDTGMSVVTADNLLVPYYLRRSTGIPSVDIALGGGWPAGALSVIAGPNSTGKNLLANMTIKHTQQTYGKDARIFIATFGGRFDKQFARKQGVVLPLDDIEKTLYTKEEQAKYNKKLGDIVFLIPDAKVSKETRSSVTLDAILRLVKSNEFQLGIIDEMGMDESTENASKALTEKASIGTSARLFSQFTRKLSSAYNTTSKKEVNNTTLLFLSQVRIKFSSYITHTDSVMGNAMKHAEAIELYLNPKELLKQKDKVVGKTIRWKLKKGKLGTHDNLNGIFNFYYDTGVDVLFDLINLLIKDDEIKQAGPWFTWEKYNIKTQGKEGLKQELEKHLPEIMEWVYTSKIKNVKFK